MSGLADDLVDSIEISNLHAIVLRQSSNFAAIFPRDFPASPLFLTRQAPSVYGRVWQPKPASYNRRATFSPANARPFIQIIERSDNASGGLAMLPHGN